MTTASLSRRVLTGLLGLTLAIAWLAAVKCSCPMPVNVRFSSKRTIPGVAAGCSLTATI